MDPDMRIALKAGLHDVAVNGIKLVAALCVLAFVLGGSDTRGWMLGFFAGTTSSLLGTSNRDEHAMAEAAPPPPLQLLGHGCQQEYGYQMCEGEVRNTSNDRLENVMVEVRFKDKAGVFIKSEEALIAYQPLMPGQTSPFKVGTINNPLIRHYTIGFKQMFGATLRVTR